MSCNSVFISPDSERFFSDFSLLLLDACEQLPFYITQNRNKGFGIQEKKVGKIARLLRCIQTLCGTSYDLKQHVATLLPLANSRMRVAKSAKKIELEAISELFSLSQALRFYSPYIPELSSVSKTAGIMASCQTQSFLQQSTPNDRKSRHLINTRQKVLSQMWELGEQIEKQKERIYLLKTYGSGASDADLLKKSDLINTLGQLASKLHATQHPRSFFPKTSNVLPTTPDAIASEARVHAILSGPMSAVTCDVASFSSVPDLFAQLFTKHQGICIGERHDEDITGYLTKHMKVLKALGVSTIFTEHFYYTRQTYIDGYLRTGSLELAKKAMRRPDNQISQFWQAFAYVKPFFEAAREAGIRIVGIDGHTHPNGLSRIRDFNYLACRIIEREKGPGKFIAHVGNAHLNEAYKGAAMGLSELTRSPAVRLIQTDHSQLDKHIYSPPHFTCTV